MAGPHTQAIEDESRAFERWDHLANLEESFLKQKSKLHWLNVGDRNNKYFHNVVTERASKNAIKEILNSDGTQLTGTEEIKAEAVRFFSEFMNLNPLEYTCISVEQLQELLSFRCSELDGECLIRDVTEEEVQKVLFSMPSNKAPGPDGYTVEFFKEAWSLVGKEVLVAIQSFFRFGFLPKDINTTILTLIPKTTDAHAMKDYRPISCCNVLYKVISKILANRLKRFLPDFITPNQLPS